MLHITMMEMVQALWWNLAKDTQDSRDSVVLDMESHWSRGRKDAIATLSVRTTFDLFLQALNLPEGSEVVFTAITIKDMVIIAKHHKLVPVPLDLDTGTMVPVEKLLEHVFSAKTKLLVIAHIFGARMDIEPWLRYAHQRGVLVVDDCAEVFEGHDAYSGHPEADLSLFSFGSIKTCAALGGSLARVSEPRTLQRMRELHANYPIRGRKFWLKRVLTYFFLRCIQAPWICGASARVLELLGSDLDTFITNNVRGFAGMDLIFGIRHQAPLGMLKLLGRKIQNFDRRYITQRVRLARALVDQLRSSNVEMPGADCERNSFWLFPIIVANPGALIAILRRHGFDVTQGASQLNYVEVPDALVAERAQSLYPHNSRRLWLNLLYLPVYPEMPLSEVLRMGSIVKRHAVRVCGSDGGLAFDRQAAWIQLQERKFDVLVVGGGINGAAIARDAALRGLSVALVERDDFASGASGNSAKLIHGGFRYVERFMLTLVSELCHERDLQHRLNPNLVGRIPFLLPQYASYKNRMNKIDFGLWLYDACAFFASPLHSRHSPAQAVAHEPALRVEDMIGSFKYYDCWTNDARLTLSNAKQAACNGATVLNHCEFVEPLFESIPLVGSKVKGAVLKDSLTGATAQIAARHIVYAAGSEVDQLPWENNRERVIDATKGSHIVIARSRLSLSNCVGYRSPSDSRWCFCVPFENVIVIGTTDSPFDVSKGGAKVHATRSDVEYLLEATNHVFPGARLRDSDVQCTWAGLRPLVFDENHQHTLKNGGKLPWVGRFRQFAYDILGGSSAGSGRSREEKFFQDERGITVIAGGKLTPYRMVSERAVDLVARTLGLDSVSEPCVTHIVPLDSRLSFVEAGSPTWWVFGSASMWLEQRGVTHPAENECFAPPAHRLSHVSLSVLLEQALTLEDVMVRRLGLFYSLGDQGVGCASCVASHMAVLLGKNDDWAKSQVKRYRDCVADSQAWRQEPSPAPRLINSIN